jgi:hypothetical protein
MTLLANHLGHTQLAAHDRQDCSELSRLIRDDLIHLGLVDDGRSMQLSEDAQASAGDVIVCRDPCSAAGQRRSLRSDRSIAAH